VNEDKTPDPTAAAEQDPAQSDDPTGSLSGPNDPGPAGPASDRPYVDQPEGEIGGSKRPEPTRYGDWEVAGRCTDF